MNTIPIQYTRLLDASEVVERLQLPKSKQRHKWACPKCASSDALHVYPGPGRGSMCFSCGESLDAIGLVMSVAGLRFFDALKWLAADFGFSDLLDEKSAGSTLKAKRRIKDIQRQIAERERERERMEAARREDARTVWNDIWPMLTLGFAAHDYLKSRAIPYEVAHHVGIRSVESMSAWENIRAKFSACELHAAGLLGGDDADSYPFPWKVPFLVMPYWLECGGVDILRFRDLSGQAPKYLSPLGHRPQTPYLSHSAYELADDYSTLYVCEGELNTLSVLYAGAPSIGACGAATWQADWSKDFKWFSRVVVLNDGDKAGDGFAKSVHAATCEALGRAWADRRLKQQYFADGMDANDVLIKGDLEGVICG